MPGMDGFETMRMVQQLRPLVPIIVISGRPISSEPGDAPDFLTMAIKLGAVSSLQKPFKPAALLAAVDGCLEAAKRRSQPAHTRQRSCFLPVMRNSIAGFARRNFRADGRACESKDDAHNQACHRDDCAGRDRGIRGRMAELSQPGTGAPAARPRPDRDPFAACRQRARNPMSATGAATLRPFDSSPRSRD